MPSRRVSLRVSAGEATPEAIPVDLTTHGELEELVRSQAHARRCHILAMLERNCRWGLRSMDKGGLWVIGVGSRRT